jgi:hypothetical protein
MITSRRRLAQTAAAAACAAAILAPSLEARPAWSQSPAPRADASIPSREGNIYDHKRHQPTEAEVEAAEKAAGADLSPSLEIGRASDIENLRQEIERIEQAYPPTFPDESPNRQP